MNTWYRTAAATVLLAAMSPTPNSNAYGNRNVLLIIGDDIGVEQIAAYGESGYAFPATDNIDRLASAGVLFRNAWSNPVCSPMRASAYTGLHVFRHGVDRAATTSVYLPGSETTIPEVIATAGYASGLFGKWHLEADPSFANPYEAPLQHGWDRHAGTFGGSVDDYRDWERYEDGEFVGNSTTYASEAAVDDAVEWIRSRGARGQKWFATVAFNAPHTPLHWPPTGTYNPALLALGVMTGNEERFQFKAMVESLDYYIGVLLDELGDDVLRDTTVIFVGDNGTDGDVVYDPYDSTRAKGTVYEGGVNVPLIIADGYKLATGRSVPSGAPAGSVRQPGREVAALVQVVDLFPTINEIAGALGDPGDGASLIRYLENPWQAPLHETVFAQCNSQMAIRNDTYKLIVRDADGVLDEIGASATFELYDLTLDPYELDNLLVPAPSAASLDSRDELLDALEALLGS